MRLTEFKMAIAFNNNSSFSFDMSTYSISDVISDFLTNKDFEENNFRSNGTSSIAPRNGTWPTKEIADKLVRGFTEMWWNYKHVKSIVLLCFYAVCIPVALIGNLVVICLICCDKTMRNVTNVFILNLAVADLLVTLICMPMSVSTLVYQPWIYGNFLCKTMYYLQVVAIAESALTIVLVSVERFLIIRHPMHSRSYLTKRNTALLILASWIVAGVIAIPLLLVSVIDRFSDDFGFVVLTAEFCIEKWNPQMLWKRKLYDICLLIFIYVIPTAVMVGLYTASGCCLLKGSIQQFNLHQHNRNNRVIASRRKVAIMLLTVATLFALSWLPYQLGILYYDFYMARVPSDVYSVYALVALAIGHSNCAQNPFLYFFLNSRFRRGMQGVFCRQCARMNTAPQVNQATMDGESAGPTGRTYTSVFNRIRSSRKPRTTATPFVAQAVEIECHIEPQEEEAL